MNTHPGKPRCCPTFFSLRAPRVLVALLASSRFLSAEPAVVTDVSVSPTQIILTFQDDGSSNQFTLQKTLGLDAASWNNATDATLAALGNNRYTFSVPRSSADTQFYRILGTLITGTALDPDGDGLATVFEQSLSNNPDSPDFSNPNLFDTDGDGFSDGTEFALGTKPNDASSTPQFASIPAIRFAAPFSSATEGPAPHLITIEGSNGYSGTIEFTVNARSTATSPAEFTLASSSVIMTNGAATIRVNLVDDLILSPERLILIDLKINPTGNDYRAAGAVTHVVNLSDNDHYWNGALVDGDTTRDFRLCIRRNAGTTLMDFVSGASDGLPIPDGGASSQSTGLIPDVDLAGVPQEIFPATGPTITPTTFAASTPELPAPTNGPFAGVSLKRVIALNADSVAFAGQGHSVTPELIIGSFTETISHATDPAVTYLNSTTTGNFVLARDQAAPPVLPSVFGP